MGNTHANDVDRLAKKKKAQIKELNEKRIGIHYKGEMSKSKKHGIAVEIYQSEEGLAMYIGYFKKGYRSGFGRINFYNTNEYSGFWLNNAMCGNGRIKYNEDQPETYDGQVVDNAMNGYGAFHYIDKSQYDGFWKENRMEGVGLFHSGIDSWRYAGEFAGDTMTGYGIYERELYKKLTSENKKKRFLYVYTGLFSNDAKEKYGVETFKFNDTVSVLGYRYPEKIDKEALTSDPKYEMFNKPGTIVEDGMVEIQKVLYEEVLGEDDLKSQITVEQKSRVGSILSLKNERASSAENSSRNLFGKRVDSICKYSFTNKARLSMNNKSSILKRNGPTTMNNVNRGVSFAASVNLGKPRTTQFKVENTQVNARISTIMHFRTQLLGEHVKSSKIYNEMNSRIQADESELKNKYIMVVPAPRKRKIDGKKAQLVLHKESCGPNEAFEKMRMVREAVEKRKVDIDFDPAFKWGDYELEIETIIRKANGKALYEVVDKNNASRRFLIKTYLCSSIDEIQFNCFEYAVLRLLNNSDFMPKLADLGNKSYFYASYHTDERHIQTETLPTDARKTSIKFCMALEILDTDYFLNELLSKYPFSSRDIVIISEKILDSFAMLEQNNIYHGQTYPHHIHCQDFEELSTCKVRIIDFSEAMVLKSNRVYSRHQCFLNDDFKHQILNKQDLTLETTSNKNLRKLLYQFIHPFSEYSSRTKKYMHPKIKAYYENGHMDKLEVYNVVEAEMYSLGMILLKLFCTKSPNPDIEEDLRILSETTGSADKILDKICTPIVQMDDMLEGFLEIIKLLLKGGLPSILDSYEKFRHVHRNLTKPLRTDKIVVQRPSINEDGVSLDGIMLEAKNNRASKIFTKWNKKPKLEKRKTDEESVEVLDDDDQYDNDESKVELELTAIVQNNTAINATMNASKALSPKFVIDGPNRKQTIKEVEESDSEDAGDGNASGLILTHKNPSLDSKKKNDNKLRKLNERSDDEEIDGGEDDGDGDVDGEEDDEEEIFDSDESDPDEPEDDDEAWDYNPNKNNSKGSISPAKERLSRITASASSSIKKLEDNRQESSEDFDDIKYAGKRSIFTGSVKNA